MSGHCSQAFAWLTTESSNGSRPLTTLAEAQEGADDLRADPLRRNVHREVLRFCRVASCSRWKSDGTAARLATSYAVSDFGVTVRRSARICASWRCSSAVSASPRALAMNRSSTLAPGRYWHPDSWWDWQA